MDEAGTWHRGRPQPRRLCFRGDLVPLPQKGAEPLPNFRPISIVANGWMHQDAMLGMELGLDPGEFVLDFDPVAPPQEGGRPPNFRPMFIVTKRLDG